MLGWFKKKRSKQQTEAVVSEVEKSPGPEPVSDTEVNEATYETSDTSAVSLQQAEKETSSQSFSVQNGSSIDDTETEIPEVKASLFKRLSNKLSRTRESIVYKMDTLFLGKKEIDAELLDDLEELLITSDIGVGTATELLDYARRKVSRNELADPAALKIFIKEKLRSYISESSRPAEQVVPQTYPFVIMVVGVNGVGKTTTIGKITHKFLQSGQKVLLVAGDTFRAAAVSQLKIWGERNKVEVVSGEEGSDPSSVAFDAMTRAQEGTFDVVIVDTAGRLHTQTNLMEELKKIQRVIGKKIDGAPHETLLVIDATTGQNGISQARLFNEAVGVTGLALTKLDGTAKGGIVVNISRDMDIPIRFIGIGEKMEDLRDFDPDEFIEALFGEETY